MDSQTQPQEPDLPRNRSVFVGIQVFCRCLFWGISTSCARQTRRKTLTPTVSTPRYTSLTLLGSRDRLFHAILVAKGQHVQRIPVSLVYASCRCYNLSRPLRAGTSDVRHYFGWNLHIDWGMDFLFLVADHTVPS